MFTLSLVFYSCDDVVESDIMLDYDEVVGIWDIVSFLDTGTISFSGKEIYYFTGLTGIIWDTVTVDTSIYVCDSSSSPLSNSYLHLKEDNRYVLQLDSNVVGVEAIIDSGSWEFLGGVSWLKLTSDFDTLYSMTLSGISSVNSINLTESINYDTIIRSDNVSVKCTASGKVKKHLYTK